ncbi:FCD domain-containing protein [Gammaproteobacteria bacterium AS21]|jgi:GntR family transcriptional activator of glc operon
MPQTQSIPISRSIAHRIEQLILDGSLAPEQKLPSERQLSSQLGVSRSIIREALRELQGRAVIETRHGQGSFVAKIVAEPDDNSPLLKLFFGHSRTLYDLYEVRAQLEGQAANLAAQRANEKDLYAITKAFKAMEVADPLKNASLDHAFHQAIAEASHNPVLVHVLSSLNELIFHSVQASVVNLSHREAFKKQLDKLHRQIYHAVISGQGAWAQKAAIAHVEYVSDSLQQIEKEEHIIIRTAMDKS